ncbi:putative LRR receptor-like serine/threonine-protein kinase [Cardamine amara subsp. amara]|uniref:LRR receptor-like serine/threonine-protein kinase n=1 Tax=Cardamine amara subsp. amara TaxID=228776 RepID=A0ABD1AEE1_CARAN
MLNGGFSFLLLFFTIITIFFAISTSVLSDLHPDEWETLKTIANTLGIEGLDPRNGDPCSLKTLNITTALNLDINNVISCDFKIYNNSHITRIELNSLSLPGKLPPELADLQYLQSM